MDLLLDPFALRTERLDFVREIVKLIDPLHLIASGNHAGTLFGALQAPFSSNSVSSERAIWG